MTAPNPPVAGLAADGSNGAVATDRKTTTQTSGEDTRARMVAAALSTIRTDGIASVSARSIARTGGFNQALIFYHFGSVDGLLVAASRAESERRSALYAERLGGVTSLPDLVRVARDLHEEEAKHGSVAVLSQMLAGAATSPELAAGVRDGFDPWMALVEEAVTRVLAGTPYAGIVPVEDLSFAIASMFLGMELITGLQPEASRDRSLFVTLEALATLVDLLLASPPPNP